MRARIKNVDKFRYYDVEDEQHPEIRRSYRKQLWFEILIPVAIALAAVAGLAIALARSGLGTASAWADAALALMMLPFLLLGLLPLALVIALAYGIGWLTGKVPPPLRKLRVAVFRASISAQRAADLAVEPIIRGRAARAAAGQALHSLVDIVRSNNKQPRG